MAEPTSACLTDEKISAFVERSLSPEHTRDVERHLADCISCRELAEALARMSMADADEAQPAADGPVPRGARVGRYEVLDVLGAGGMGIVYRAYNPALDRNVALKLLGAKIGEPALEARFLREAKAMARLSHPDVIAIYDAGTHGRQLFIAMELVHGGTLREWLTAPRKWRQTLSVCLRAGRGLAAAHEVGLVHRDFKPDNVLVSSAGDVRVTDFGLARTVDQPRDDDRSSTDPTDAIATKTRTGALVGTPAYMPPEQWRAEPATVASDVFSFCATTYEALYGVRPFAGGELRALRDNVIAGNIRPPAARGAVPGALRRVLVRGLRPRPEDRPPSMNVLLAQLRRAARSRLLVGASLATAALVIVGVLVVAGSLSRRQASTARSSKARPSVAVVGLWDAAHASEHGWVEPVLGELLAAQLGAGERMRVLPGDTAARLRRSFQLESAAEISNEAVVRFARAAGVEYVVLGRFSTVAGRVRIDGALRDGVHGGSLTKLRADADEAALGPMVEEIGDRVRRETGVGAASAAEIGAAISVLPQGRDAMKWYAVGLDALERGEAPEARDALARSVSIDASSPLSHRALAVALTRLGSTDAAGDEAKRAVEGAARLGRAAELGIEGLSFELQRAWPQAIDTYKALYRFYPDEIEHGLRLANAQSKAERFADAFATLDELRRAPSPVSDDPQIDLAEARVANATADFRRDERAAAEAARKAEALGARAVLADARATEAWALIQLGELEKARVAIEEAGRLYRELGDRGGRAFTLHLSSQVAEARGDLGAALPLEEEALATMRSVGDGRRVEQYLNVLAGIHGRLGRLSQAAAEYEEVAKLARESHRGANVGAAESNLGWVRAALGQFEQGRAALDTAIANDRALGIRKEYFHLVYRAALEMLAGDLERARQAAEQGAALAHAAAKDDLEASAHELLALSLHEQGGEVAVVQEEVDRAASLVHPGASGASDLLLMRAILAMDDGHAAEGAELAEQAESFFRASQALDEAAIAAALVCRARVAAKDLAGAAPWCDRADARANVTEALEVSVRTAIARAELAWAVDRAAGPDARLEAAIGRARLAGSFALELDARVTAAKIDGRRAGVAELAREASAHGFGRIARQLRAGR